MLNYVPLQVYLWTATTLNIYTYLLSQPILILRQFSLGVDPSMGFFPDPDPDPGIWKI